MTYSLDFRKKALLIKDKEGLGFAKLFEPIKRMGVLSFVLMNPGFLMTCPAPMGMG